MKKKNSKEDTIIDTIKEVANEIENWPEWKKSFCCMESDNSFKKVEKKEEYK